MLIFSEKIKELIYHIESTGGKKSLKTSPPETLVLEVKNYLILSLKQSSKYLDYSVTRGLIENLFNGYFDKSIDACFCLMQEVGLNLEEQIVSTMKSAIDKILIDLRDKRKESNKWNQGSSVDDAIVDHLSYVIKGDTPEIITLYDFAKCRCLISWNYNDNKWQTTGLGKFLLELTPFQVLVFLLTIDLTLNSNERDFTYLTEKFLKALYKKEKIQIHQLLEYRRMMQLMGLIRSIPERIEYELSSLGNGIVENTLSVDNRMKEIVKTLLSNEEKGITFIGSEQEIELLQKELLNEELLEEKNCASIKNSIDFYRSGNYLDATKILYPSIEFLANQMLLEVNEDISKMHGLAKKLKKLVQLDLIPADLSDSIEITTSRNKVLHGEFNPEEQIYAYPLYISGIIYTRQLINTFKKLKLAKNRRNST